MKFRYELEVKKMPFPIQYTDRLWLIGSCFTENIGEKLRYNGFHVFENPNGILFNPISVGEAIANAVEQKKITATDLFELNEGFHSWQHHSRFSGTSADEVVGKINQSTMAANQSLQHATHVLITIGSAWVYQLTNKAANYAVNKVAANNHKAPADWFSKALMSADEVNNVLATILSNIKKINADCKVIFTISPVRHLREGAVENNRSKAALITAVHNIVSEHDNCYYFPAYELVMDDLRDYRFYAEDLVHPNYYATQYVWEKFVSACISEEAYGLMEQIQDIKQAFKHKPFNGKSKQHQQFMQNYYTKTKNLLAQHPYLLLAEELTYFGNTP